MKRLCIGSRLHDDRHGDRDDGGLCIAARRFRASCVFFFDASSHHGSRTHPMLVFVDLERRPEHPGRLGLACDHEASDRPSARYRFQLSSGILLLGYIRCIALCTRTRTRRRYSSVP